MTQDALDSKREQLEELEKSEREARRLELALGRGRVNSEGSVASPTADQGEEEPLRRDSQSAYLPPHPGPNPSRRRAPGMGLLNAISYTLHGMMDVDPETARRNGITKTRESISQVCFTAIYYIPPFLTQRAARGRAPSVCTRPQILKLYHPSRFRSIPKTESR
jgi:hypothetical protein